jgi:hypothetical protein
MLSPGLRVYTRISLNFFNTNLETFHKLYVADERISVPLFRMFGKPNTLMFATTTLKK